MCVCVCVCVCVFYIYQKVNMGQVLDYLILLTPYNVCTIIICRLGDMFRKNHFCRCINMRVAHFIRKLSLVIYINTFKDYIYQLALLYPILICCSSTNVVRKGIMMLCAKTPLSNLTPPALTRKNNPVCMSY